MNMQTQAKADASTKAGLRAQFGHPQGLAGWLIGHLMAAKNGERGRWVVSLLDLRPGQSILEVGFGPGTEIRRASKLVEGGSFAGIDRSAEMCRQARARNAGLAAAGRLELVQGSVTSMPFDSARFDRVFAINSVQFWEPLDAALKEIWRVLRPGGRVAIAIQPRNRGATEETTGQWGMRLDDALRRLGCVGVRVERLAMRPVSAVCAVAEKPAGAD